MRPRAWISFSRIAPLFFLLILLISPYPLSAQDVASTETVAILPVTGKSLSTQASWRVSGYLSDFIQRKYGYYVLDERYLREYYQKHRVVLDTVTARLQTMARDFHVKKILMPEWVQQGQQSIFRLYLYDAQQNKITKIANRPCACQENNPESFPFARLTELIFETPEIILGVNLPGEEPAAPPPVVLPQPKKKEKTGGESEATEPDSVAKVQGLILPPKRSGLGWKRYAAGAVLVSGGVLYLLTRSGNGAGNPPGGKLPDPPKPPNSN